MNPADARAVAIQASARIVQSLLDPNVEPSTVKDGEQYLFILANDITTYILTGENCHL